MNTPIKRKLAAILSADVAGYWRPAASEIQDALKTRDDSLPEDSRMAFRIGVHLGDVMIKGGDLLGDGVNVAARLQAGPAAGPAVARFTLRAVSPSEP